MQSKSKHTDYLIARVISGEASEKEKDELKLWMDQNEANRKYFEGIRFADQQAAAAHRVHKVDVDKAWQKVHSQMQSSKTNAYKSARIVTMKAFLRIAAVLVLVSGISFFVYHYYTSMHVLDFVSVASTDKIIEHILADSTTFVLNRDSQIEYADNYGKKERRVTLQGEAFFDVKPMPDKPFIVESNETFIRVTGTSFNVKGSEPDSLVEVYVKSGSVVFFTETVTGITLVAGEMGVYNKKRKTFTKIIEITENPAAYATRVFIFYNTSLNEVYRQLSRVYDVNIELANPETGLCTITVSFNNDDIETIMSIIAETLKLGITKSEGKYFVTGEGCNTKQNTD